MHGSPGESSFPYGSNSLNLFRLILAFFVLWVHSYAVLGLPDAPAIAGVSLGTWAVYAFFLISGALITRSRLKTTAGAYLVHRVARIMPGFLVCLVVTAFVFAPVALLISRGSLEGFLDEGPTPVQYVWSDLFLRINTYQIGQTLADVPYPHVWNGSLWSLYFEFLCYLVVGLLGGLAVFRRSIRFVALLWAIAVGVRGLMAAGRTGGLDGDFDLLSQLLPFFLAGALVFLVVDRWGMSRLSGILGMPLAAVVIAVVPGAGVQLAAPLIGYGLLFLSTVVRQPRWIARNDVSYGFYIYAWPVQQLAVTVGGPSTNLFVLILVCTAVTFALAWASWLLVERPVIRRVRRATAAAAPPVPPGPAVPRSSSAEPEAVGFRG